MNAEQRAIQQQIIQALRVQPEIDPAMEVRRSVDFMKDYLRQNPGLKTLVLGISGGQDSTLAGKLSQQAVTELRQETGDADYQFIAVRLPYGEQADEADAMAAIDFIQPDQTERVNIKAATDAMVVAVDANDETLSDFNKGNLKARERMIAQFAIAGAHHGVVVGTDHAAEAVTGFYTKFGDGAADITPLWRLDKRQGRELLEYLEAPAALIAKTPTADLEDDRPALPDEVALGVSYSEIDAFLEGQDVSEQAAATIEDWYRKTEHKRHTPITVYDDFWKN
ncbi:ammonia-dependent NAD(+) synthetase [Fructilactobacillus cliffordii]|uniref:NH(3)-dependent NAD(+) synthetase n=1 Tax=Fructilactobacillus cliffordii TaxID=2940299 RepID=A0A9Q9E020_9LACO|nr:ammonia-dependent NAD(+) synthetase [Fructilactobacillus cliffordii]USS87022.1 ammonia-dependent NAD(+) synthetase [Fructilactobacillus cliffordii]USS88746.1 ammonia-dependent NAD(+) synthetase [Fructilactobacillus cliffordii]